MTQQETDKELFEIFSHKKALTDNIEYDTGLLLKYEAVNDKEMVDRGRGIISFLVTEREKLSHKRIAQQLGLNEREVRWKYREFVGSRF